MLNFLAGRHLAYARDSIGSAGSFPSIIETKKQEHIDPLEKKDKEELPPPKFTEEEIKTIKVLNDSLDLQKIGVLSEKEQELLQTVLERVANQEPVTELLADLGKIVDKLNNFLNNQSQNIVEEKKVKDESKGEILLDEDGIKIEKLYNQEIKYEKFHKNKIEDENLNEDLNIDEIMPENSDDDEIKVEKHINEITLNNQEEISKDSLIEKKDEGKGIEKKLLSQETFGSLESERNTMKLLARKPDLDLETQLLLAKKDVSVRFELVTNPNTDPKVLRMLANDTDDIVLSAICYRPNNDDETLMVLASNKKTRPDLLDDLAKSKNAAIQMVVASNSRTKDDTLWKLAKDENPEVAAAAYRALLGRNKVKLETLAEDKYPEVRLLAASNSSTDNKTLQKLTKDKNSEVVVAANLTLMEKKQITPQKLAQNQQYPELRLQAISHPDMDAKSLLTLIEDKNQNVAKAALQRLLVLANDDASILKKLAQSKDMGIQILACQHPKATSDMKVKLQKLITDVLKETNTSSTLLGTLDIKQLKPNQIHRQFRGWVVNEHRRGNNTYNY